MIRVGSSNVITSVKTGATVALITGMWVRFHVQCLPSTSMRLRYGVSFVRSTGSVRTSHTWSGEERRVASDLLRARKRFTRQA